MKNSSRQHSRIALLVFLLGVLAASIMLLCFVLSKTSDAELTRESGEAYGLARPEPPLEETEWVWQHSEFPNGSLVVPGAQAFILFFQSDGRLTSTTDCNSHFGEYAVGEGRLMIGELAATKKYCGPATLESEYAKELSRAETFVIRGEELHIELEEGTGTMVFAALAL